MTSQVLWTSKDIINLKKANIFVVGDIILDTYIEGKVSRISPEAPVPVLLENGQRNVPGGAGNVAANIATMGAKVFLCGRIGQDEEGKKLLNILNQFKIETKSMLKSAHVPTISKIRILSGNIFSSGSQQIVRIDKEIIEPISQEEENNVITQFELFLKEHPKDNALILSDYGKGFLSKSLISKLISIATNINVPIITDPKHTDVDRYSGSTVIKPNLSEGRSLYRVQFPGVFFKNFEEEIHAISDCYLKNSGANNLVMSLSEHGVLAVGKDIPNGLHLETKALQVADVSGAGDTLVAFLAMGLAVKLSLSKTTEIGNIAAGIVCGKLGTATLTGSEFLEHFKALKESPIQEKNLELNSLIELLKDLKAENKKIVFTNGCFDILHAGHVDYLQKARALGDILIVGLNTDDSISRLKGPKRPLQPLNDRSIILSALTCIDYVVPFDDDTPLNLILALKPDIIVKGSDYNIENTIGAKEVIEWGGSVHHINLLSGRSTTKIIERALK